MVYRRAIVAAAAALLAVIVAAPPAVAAPAPKSHVLDNTQEVFGISCPNATVCWVTGATGGTQEGGTGFLVKITDGVPGPEKPVPSTAEINSISCPTAAFCEAQVDIIAGGGVGLMAIHNGKPAKPVAAGSRFIQTVTCFSAAICEGVGQTRPVSPYKERPVVVSITNGKPGKTHVVPNAVGLGSGLGAVSCPTSTVCYAVGGGVFGKSLVYKSLSVLILHGLPGQPHFKTGSISMSDISCGSPTTCFAVGTNAPEAVAPTAVVEPVVGGVIGPFHTVGRASGGSSISCTAASTCQGSGDYTPDPNNPYVSSGVTFDVTGGLPHLATPISGTSQLYANSCPTNGPCASGGATTDVPGQQGVVVTTLSKPRKSTLKLAADPKSTKPGNLITLTLTVSRLSKAPHATGGVSFTIGSKTLCSEAQLRAASNAAAAVCKVHGSTLGSGKHTIKAAYDGDTNYKPGSATTKVTVAKT